MVPKAVLLCSIVFKFVVMIVGVCGNIAVIIVTRTSKFWSRQKTKTSYLVGSLGLADLLMCLTLYPVWIVEFILSILNVESDQVLFCSLSRPFPNALLFASVASLLAITVDRYIYIVKPLKYSLIVTSRRVFAVVFAIWLTTCSTFALWYVYFGKYDAGLRGLCVVSKYIEYPLHTFCTYIPVTVMIILNLRMFFVSRRQRQKILAGIPLAPTSNSNGDSHHRKSRVRTVLRFFIVQKEVKTFSIVVAVLMLCIFAPTLIGTMLFRFCSQEVWNYWYLIFHYEFYGINSVVNAFIYGMRHVKYREAFRKIFFKATFCFKLND